MKQETVISTCDCSDEAHIITLNLWGEEDISELYIGVQLNPSLGIFKRIWVALKYILGKRSKFGSNGHWDSGSFSSESAIEARKLLDSFIEKRANDTI